MGRKLLLLLVLAAPPAAAQVQSRPTDHPAVTAANESWYQRREPIQFAGAMYFRAGATVFFDGNTMVRSGHYNGVPLYMDTTVEPFSVVLVPVTRGLLQPYERRRRGELAGTTASRTPSFPVSVIAEGVFLPGAAAAPTQLQQPIGAISASMPTETAPATAPAGAARTVGAQSSLPAVLPDTKQEPLVTLLRPQNNDGLWIQYAGARWRSAGTAVPLRSTEFRVIGQYAGFPVFVRQDEEGTIYLPTRAGLVAPYRTK